MKILLIDDHSLFRAGLRLLLGRLGEALEVLEAESVETGLVVAQTNPDLDLVLLDLNLPGMHGLDGLLQFRRRFPSVSVLLVSAADFDDIIAEGRAKGAQGFIAKSVSAEEMIEAVRHVLSGELWFPNQFRSIAPVPLSPRQREVLAGLCKGQSNKEIGRELALSENTVRSHVAVIFRALGVNSRTEAAMAARRHGFI